MVGHPVMAVDDMDEGLVQPREMEFFSVLNQLKQLQQAEIYGDVSFHSFPFELTFGKLINSPSLWKESTPFMPS